MGLPNVVVNKVASGGGTVPQSPTGVAAIIAPCSGSGSALPTNEATAWNSPQALQAAGIAGPLCELGAYQLTPQQAAGVGAVQGKPIVAVKPTTTTAAKYVGPRSAAVMVQSVTNGPPAALTVTAGHGLVTGDVVTISGATGDTAINGTFPVIVTTPTVFTIPVTGSGSYTAGSATVTPTGLSTSIAGTAEPSLGSASAVADDYNQPFNAMVGQTMASPIPNALAGLVAGVLLYVVTGGTLGTAGIQYVYSLDGGNSCSPLQNLGTALTFAPTEPVTGADTGVRITLGTAGQTYAAGDYLWVCTVGPRMQSADLIAALQALYLTKLPFDMVLVHGETASGLVSTIEAWVLTMNLQGIFPTVCVNTRFKNQTPGAVETETAYALAVTTILTPCVGEDVVGGVDGGAVVSPLSGVVKAYPTSLAVLSVCEANPTGVDPSEEDLGPVGGFDIDGPNLTPSFHDEGKTNTLDTTGGSLRATTLRSWSGQSGAFITNAYLLSAPGSDYVYVQNNRVMNAACAACWQQLRKYMSKGVPRNPVTNLILEPVADAWENAITAIAVTATKGQISGLAFRISRNDVLSGNGPQTVNSYLTVNGLVYPKNIIVTANFGSTG